jgi:hypothetical protein
MLTYKTLGVAVLCAAACPLYAAGFDGWPAAADEDLDQMRGGFASSNNGVPLSFSFGIERATFLNGQLVSTTTIAIPTLPYVNNSAAATADFSPVTVIQNGSGNFFNLQGAHNLPTSVMTVIQNSLDNQVIGNATVINASVTSRAFLNSLAVQSVLNQMMFKSLR